MRSFALLAGLWTTRILAMHMNTFLQAFNRLGLAQWDGIELDIAWGHVTSLMGLSRPSIDGPIFIYRAPCQIGGQSPHRVRLVATTNSGPEPLLAEIASHFDDLANPVQFEPWRLLTIDTSRGRSRNRELHHPCYILVDFCAFRSFGLRPHGVIEVVLGQEEFSFPTVLPMAVNVVVLGDFLAPLLLTGLQGLQWQAWLNGELLGLPLVTCQEGFFIQVQVLVWTNLDAEHDGSGPFDLSALSILIWMLCLTRLLSVSLHTYQVAILSYRHACSRLHACGQ